MSFVSLEFIMFVLFSLVLYYVMPAKVRWIALLVVSYAFYLIGGGKAVAYVLFTTLTTYLSGLALEGLNAKLNKIKNKLITNTGPHLYT